MKREKSYTIVGASGSGKSTLLNLLMGTYQGYEGSLMMDGMLVDEATSALDNESALHVSEAILDLSGLTRIVVTHRIDAAVFRRYDSILMKKTVCCVNREALTNSWNEKGNFIPCTPCPTDKIMVIF